MGEMRATESGPGSEHVLDSLRGALRAEPRLGPRFHPEILRLDPDGTLTISAEVTDIAAKRRALSILAAQPQVGAIVDRLRVTPAVRMGDGQIRSHLRRFFRAAPAFSGHLIREMAVERMANAPEFAVVAGDPLTARHRIDIEVRRGVVILNGTVGGLVGKRLAGAMCWWVPGVRDVVNGLEADPPEEDAPIRLEEAVRVVLETDPYLDAGQIRVGVRGRVVRLTGALRSRALSQLAERDAWAVLGVDQVENEIAVVP
ncbi:BON domain-containing protein [Halovulum dunhuangense]|uniref:BON domain-containing protein n=1 Tax=Halovulum dunhuangense TaxID=1505036 RepID=A0A849KZB1_9RHOB|nr:BON domain-containing protein [Halovulum dunhuangense]NNU79432.1 BON domain-containing protein [Halovulum dunhuangense]